MKKLLIQYILCFAVAYLLMGFVQWKLNPAQFTNSNRADIIGIGIILCVLYSYLLIVLGHLKK